MAREAVPDSRQKPLSTFWAALVATWLVTAAWDFACASLLGVFGYGATFGRFWQGVGSVPFGRAVLDSGSRGVVLGITAHFCVALFWSLLFVTALRLSSSLRRVVAEPAGTLAVAAIYGPIIWMVMSLLVIHTATGKMPILNQRWWVQVFAHIPFVTIPLVFTARRFMVR